MTKPNESGEIPEGKEAARKPDYKGDGVAVWVNNDKNGKPYLSITQVGHNKILAFQN